MNEDLAIKKQEGHHLEVTKRFLEVENEKAIISCLETLDLKGSSIGIGNNAEVFKVEGEPMLENLCIKKVAKLPLVKINDIETEFEFQEAVNDLGIRTPRNIMVVQDMETRDQYIIMEKIRGDSIGDLTSPDSNAIITDKYQHGPFFDELRNMIKKMHESRIYHRDLHPGNVMVDQNGHPVIIDFGAAAYGHGDGDEIYMAQGFRLEDPVSGRYAYGTSLLPDDDKQVGLLEIQMRLFK